MRRRTFDLFAYVYDMYQSCTREVLTRLPQTQVRPLLFYACVVFVMF